jgi:Tfp pilus assembly protein PilN
MNLKSILKKILSLLRARSPIGGLEISDSGARFAFWNEKTWEFASVKFAPGTIAGEHIKNLPEFIAALRLLRKNILGKKSKSQIKANAVVSLGSVGIYTQVFTLPAVEGENLEKAVQLNMQMVSPADLSTVYSGWQIVNRDSDNRQLDVLGSFLNRSTVDEITAALREAGFLPVAVESRALSLARLIRDAAAGFDYKKAYVVVSLDDSGLDIFVIRHGQLYFEYFNSWLDLQGESRQISLDEFKALITRNLNQVINFYRSHWLDVLEDVIISATGLNDEIAKLVKERFGMNPQNLMLTLRQPVGNELFLAIGSGLRGILSRRLDTDISLLGVDAQEEFRREEAISFTNFWRVLAPTALAIMLLVFGIADFSVSKSIAGLETNNIFHLGPEQAKEISSLESRATAFNNAVTMIGAIRAPANKKLPLIEKIAGVLASSSVALSHLTIQGTNAPITLSGYATSQDNILAFKRAIDTDPVFQNVNLPLTNIRSDPQGFTFSISFSMQLPNTP